MLPVWKGCMFSLVWHWCEWLSQLFIPRCEFFVGFSETKPLTNYFSPFSLLQIIFLFASYYFFKFFCQNFPLQIGHSSCLLSYLGSGMVQSCGEAPAQLLLLQSTGFHPWQRECCLPCLLHLLWSTSSQAMGHPWERELSSEASQTLWCFPTSWKEDYSFCDPSFTEKAKSPSAQPLLPTGKEEEKERGKRKKEREKEKDLCVAGISHQCHCKLAAFEANLACSAIRTGRNGKLEGSARARLPKYSWTVSLIPTLKISQILPDTRFLPVPKGPLFLRTSTFNHLQSERISLLLLTKTDIIESALKISLPWHNIITF